MNLFQFICGFFCLFCYYFINKRIDRVNDKIAELDSLILRMRCDIGILSDNQQSAFDNLVNIMNGLDGVDNEE